MEELLVAYLGLVKKHGSLEVAKGFIPTVRDRSFDDRMGLGIFVAADLGHSFEHSEPDAPRSNGPKQPGPIDQPCLICHRRLHVPVDRGEAEGSAVEAECSKTAGSTAEN